MVRTSHLATGEVGVEFVERNVAQEVWGEREHGEMFEDEAVDEGAESLQAVEQRQLLQVQVVVLAHLCLQELAAEIHRSPYLNNA